MLEMTAIQSDRAPIHGSDQPGTESIETHSWGPARGVWEEAGEWCSGDLSLPNPKQNSPASIVKLDGINRKEQAFGSGLRPHCRIKLSSWQTMSSRHDDTSKASPDKMRKLKELLHKSDNRVCADCSAPDPKWASADIGVFICLKCSGVHRSLGTHISKVLSVTLDEWTEDEIDSMIEVGGNSYANAIYEAFLTESCRKPHPGSSHEERASFIRSKYELQEFLKPSLRIVSNKSSFQASDSGKDLDAPHSDSFKSEVGMVEFIGILKVKVIRGSKLAVRDLLSSDPYVVLTLGQQKAQTSVIKRNLNPVWNEELKLSVPQDYGPLKLQVFDHDMISKDDPMGEAEVDLQPMITGAMAFGDPELLADMQIGKWLQSQDNALTKDSTINVVDGKVKQEVSLRLQNVETGEIDLELEWIPLNQ